MQRFCQRCRLTRVVNWARPGSMTYCEDCLEALADGVLTPAQMRQRTRRATLAKKRRVDRTAENLAWVNAYKRERGCPHCREIDPCCLDLHHEDPAMKESEISLLIRSASLEVVKNEVAKCKVLCSNCHRKFHHHLREFGAPVPTPSRIKTKPAPRTLVQPERPAGFAETMAELRRQCFPDAQELEERAQEDDVFVRALALIGPVLAEMPLKLLARRRNALGAALARLDAEIAARTQ